MMPFYYNSKVRSVPEYLRLRFNDATHVLNSVSFAVATVLIAGVNLFAMALVIRLLLGWPIPISIVLAAGININLWAGLIILAGGVVFLAWARLRPLRATDLQATDTDRPAGEG
jgi:Na+/proline symporter